MLLLITNSAGREFAVRYVKTGERYGRDFRIVNDETDRMGNGEPMVEFWDLSNSFDQVDPEVVSVRGQFTGGRYGVDTLLGLNQWGSGSGGLCLDGGNADVWSIDAKTMQVVRAWVNGVLGRSPVHSV